MNSDWRKIAILFCSRVVVNNASIGFIQMQSCPLKNSVWIEQLQKFTMFAEYQGAL